MFVKFRADNQYCPTPRSESFNPIRRHSELAQRVLVVACLGLATCWAIVMAGRGHIFPGPGTLPSTLVEDETYAPTRHTRLQTPCRVSQYGASGCTTRDLTVAFALIGRDVADELPYILRNIERMALSVFKRTHVIMVENDCMDNTTQVFLDWAANHSHNGSTGGFGVAQLLSLPQNTGPKKSFKVLAKARNVYLQHLMRPEFDDVDFIIPVDTDMCHPWDVDLYRKVIDNLLPVFAAEWHVIYAHGVCGWWVDQAQPQVDLVPLPDGHRGMLASNKACVGTYCDLFALRDWRGNAYNWTVPVHLTPGRCDVGSGPALGCRIISGESVVPVQSAFGGFGIYWRGLFLDGAGDMVPKEKGSLSGVGGQCVYESTEDEPCEHVPLSKCLMSMKGAKQLIATRMVMDWEGCSGPVRDFAHPFKCMVWRDAPSSTFGDGN